MAAGGVFVAPVAMGYWIKSINRGLLYGKTLDYSRRDHHNFNRV